MAACERCGPSDQELFEGYQPTHRDKARSRRLTLAAGVTAAVSTAVLVGGAFAGWDSDPPVPASVQRDRVVAEAKALYGRSPLDAFLLTYVHPERVTTSTGPGTLTAEIGQTCLGRIASSFQVGPPDGPGTVNIIPAGYRGDVAALHFRVVPAEGVPGGVLVPDPETEDRIAGDGCAVADGSLALRTTTGSSEDIRWGVATWTSAPPIALVEPFPLAGPDQS